jgi:RimJ/RimL family protein N-acetyltransferase
VRPDLAVRPMLPDEAPLVVRYFLDASPADLGRMGVDPAKLPDPASWERSLRSTLANPPPASPSAYYTWLVGGEPVGFSSLKDVEVGGTASQHLHMWSAGHRGQGHGAILFCLTAVAAHDRFRLRSILCEPKASNPMPNRLLARVGFPLVRTYEGASSDLSAVTTLNRYEVRRDIAQAYLRSAGFA